MIRRRANAGSPDSVVEYFDGLRADYNAGKSSKFRRRRTGITTTGSNADYHYRSDRQFFGAIELARDIDRNDVIVGQGVSRLVDNVLQDGMRVDPQTGDDDANARLAELWDEWSTTPELCDATGELCLHEKARLTLRHTVVDGDVFHLPLSSNGTLRSIEAHRVRTPRSVRRNVIHGIVVDKNKKPTEYWITRFDADPYHQPGKLADVQSYPARDSEGRKNVLHVYLPERFSQTRGVTAFARSVDAISMHDDIEFAKLIQQQIVSCFAILRHQPLDPIAGTNSGQTGARSTEVMADGVTKLLEGISPAMDITSRPGEKLEGFAPRVPNPEFFQHAMLVLTFISVNLGLPVAVLLLDPSQTNFSGWRGAIDQARIGFKRMQLAMIERFYRPIYEWRVRRWMLEDDLLAEAMHRGVNLFKHRWHPPRWRYIEPLKDAQAERVAREALLTSPRRISAEKGQDWEEIADEIAADNARLIRAAKQQAMAINAEIADDSPVDWRELLQPVPANPATATIGLEETTQTAGASG